MKAQEIIEVRMEPRWLLESKVSAFTQTEDSYVGLIVNWSYNGLMISTYQALEIGQVLELELVDITHDHSKRTARCTVEVVWNQELTPSLHSNGLFVREGSDVLMSMIREYGQD